MLVVTYLRILLTSLCQSFKSFYDFVPVRDELISFDTSSAEICRYLLPRVKFSQYQSCDVNVNPKSNKLINERSTAVFTASKSFTANAEY